MPGESFRFLPVNEDLQLSNQIHVCAERLRDGIHDQLLILNSGRNLRRQGVRKIRDGCAIWLEVERQQ